MEEKITCCGQYMTIFHTDKLPVRKLDSKGPDHCKNLKMFFTNSFLESKYFFVPDSLCISKQTQAVHKYLHCFFTYCRNEINYFKKSYY